MRIRRSIALCLALVVMLSSVMLTGCRPESTPPEGIYALFATDYDPVEDAGIVPYLEAIKVENGKGDKRIEITFDTNTAQELFKSKYIMPYHEIVRELNKSIVMFASEQEIEMFNSNPMGWTVHEWNWNFDYNEEHSFWYIKPAKKQE